MITLLTNLTELDHYENMPHETDTTPSADLKRIQYYRNFISHKTDDKIDRLLFNEAWDDIIEVCITHCMFKCNINYTFPFSCLISYGFVYYPVVCTCNCVL